MGQRFVFYFLIVILGFSLTCQISFAQEIPFSPRENVILFTLSQLQERDRAVRDSLEQAKKKLIEKKPVKEKKASGFKNLIPPPHYYLNSSVQFDDNINSTKKEKKSDFTYFITPGVKMNFIRGGRTLNLDMHIDNKYYNKHPRSNSQNAEIGLLTNFNIGRYLLSISDDYFSNYIATPELGIKKDQFVYYWKNGFGSTLSRHFNRIGFDLGYSNTYYDYERDSRLTNHTEETFAFNQYLNIATKTQLLMEYSRGRTKYTHQSASSADSNSNNYNLGVTGALSSKLTSSVGIGYNLKDIKTGDDYRDTALSAEFGYSVSERTNFSLSVNRLIHEPSTKSSYSIENGFDLSGNNRLAFNPKFNLSFGGGVDFIDYPKLTTSPNPQRDATYSLGLGLSYAFREWLDFSLDWTHTKKKSNVTIGYNNNTIMLKTQAKF